MTKKVIRTFQYIFLSICAFISIFPFFWMIIAATNKSVDVTKGTLMPGSYFMENLKAVLSSDLQYTTAFKNSLIISVVTTILAMIVSSAAGYAFVIYRSKSRERVFNIILLSMMVPFAALMVPLFRLFSKFNSVPLLKTIALNTPGAVIVIGISTAFLIFFFRQNTESFPKEMIEAAEIDGVGRVWDLFQNFYAYHEIYLCGSDYCNLYEQLEQLSVASDRTAVSGKKNITSGYFRNGVLLYAGLWYDDDGSRAGYDPYSSDLFPVAEAVCSRHDRFRKRMINRNIWRAAVYENNRSIIAMA